MSKNTLVLITRARAHSSTPTHSPTHTRALYRSRTYVYTLAANAHTHRRRRPCALAVALLQRSARGRSFTHSSQSDFLTIYKSIPPHSPVLSCSLFFFPFFFFFFAFSLSQVVWRSHNVAVAHAASDPRHHRRPPISRKRSRTPPPPLEFDRAFRSTLPESQRTVDRHFSTLPVQELFSLSQVQSHLVNQSAQHSADRTRGLS